MDNKIAKTSAIFGGGLLSLCCGMPLLLTALGLGSIGFSSIVGFWHWYFTGAGVLAIGFGWYMYNRERKKECADGYCAPKSNTTRNILLVMTVAMMGLMSLSVYTQLKSPVSIAQNQAKGQLVNIKIEGMTCATCEMHVENSINKLPGINNVKASTPSASVWVDYDPSKCDVKQIKSVVNKSGYKAIGVIQKK